MRFILCLTLAVAALVRADETTGQTNSTTILEQYFKGDEAKLDGAINALFDRFDKTQDGVVTQDDLDAWFNKHRFLPFTGNRTIAEQAFRSQFNAFDRSKDGNVTRDEFSAVLKEQAKVPYVPNPGN